MQHPTQACCACYTSQAGRGQAALHLRLTEWKREEPEVSQMPQVTRRLATAPVSCPPPPPLLAPLHVLPALLPALSQAATSTSICTHHSRLGQRLGGGGAAAAASNLGAELGTTGSDALLPSPHTHTHTPPPPLPTFLAPNSGA